MADDDVPVTIRSHGLAEVSAAEAAEAKKGRLKHSNYFITVNTNQVFTDFQGAQLQAAVAQLDSIWLGILKHIRNYFKVPEDFKPNMVKGIEAEYSIEVGPKTKMLHLHAVLLIQHRTTLQLDYQLIKKAIISQLYPQGGGKTIHFDSRYFKDAKTTLLGYIRKNGEFLRQQKGHDMVVPK